VVVVVEAVAVVVVRVAVVLVVDHATPQQQQQQQQQQGEQRRSADGFRESFLPARHHCDAPGKFPRPGSRTQIVAALSLWENDDFLQITSNAPVLALIILSQKC